MSALAASESRLAAAFQSLPVGIAVIDAEGKVMFANAEYRRFVPEIIPSRDPKTIGRWRGWDSDN